MGTDWSKLYKKYKGMWVALADDNQTVLGHGATVKEALKMAQNKTKKVPFFTRVPQTMDAYVGLTYEI